MESVQKIEAKFFPHYGNLHQSDFGMELSETYGNLGYGIFLKLLEKLTITDERKLSYDEKSLRRLAHLFYIIGDDDFNVLKAIIDTYFDNDGMYFWNNEHNASLEPYDKKMEGYSNGGKTTQAKFTKKELSENGKKLAERRWGKKEDEPDANLVGIECELLDNTILDQIELDKTVLKDTGLDNTKSNEIGLEKTELNKTELDEIKPDQIKSDKSNFDENPNYNPKFEDFVISQISKTSTDNSFTPIDEKIRQQKILIRDVMLGKNPDNLSMDLLQYQLQKLKKEREANL